MEIMKLEGCLPIAWLSMDLRLVGIVPNLGKDRAAATIFKVSLKVYWQWLLPSTPPPSPQNAFSYLVSSFVCYYLIEIFFLDN